MINLKKFFKKNTVKNSTEQISHEEVDSFLEIGNLVKVARMQNDLSIEELSKISRIPKNIIYSIENNDENLRPKYPFIRSILFKLEDCLSLKKNSLVVLAGEEKIYPTENKNNFLLKNFELLNTWQGSILYFLILILSLFILKRYFSPNVNIINIQNIEEKINLK